MSEAPKFLRPVTATDAEIGHAVTFGADRPLTLECGKTPSSFTIAYMP